MSNQNTATPRFFINEGLYHQVTNQYNNSILELNLYYYKITGNRTA